VADEKMVTQLTEYYRAFMPAIRDLDREHGPLYLAMILQFEPEPEDEWTLLIGSRSLAEDPGAGTTIVAHKLSESVAPSVTRKVRRIGIIHETDPFYHAIARAIHQPIGGMAEFVQCSFDGVHVERGALFTAVSDVNQLYARRPKQRRKKKEKTPRRRTGG